MANHKSAQKRAIQNGVRRLRNSSIKTRVKNIIRDLRLSVSSKSGNRDQVAEILKTATSTINKASKRGVFHKRNASRKISRLSKLANTVKN